jgi:molybdate transport system permease protein
MSSAQRDCPSAGGGGTRASDSSSPAVSVWSRVRDVSFHFGQGSLLGWYVLLILGLLVALASFTSWGQILKALATEEIRYALRLSLVSCTLSALLSLWVAIPAGYVLSRYHFSGPGLVRRALRILRGLIDALLDIPIVLPPLVIGLALLILFQTPLGRAVERVTSVTFHVPSVVLAQFAVACAFAVRTMRVTFDQINPRTEQVAWTLGCSRRQAFWMVALPEARRGVLTAATLAWARSLGEFGPILVFSGATRLRTEVLPTSVYLEFCVGNIEAAAAVSLLMVVTAMVVLTVARMFGLRGTGLI